MAIVTNRGTSQIRTTSSYGKMNTKCNYTHWSTILEITGTLHLLYGTCQQILWEGLNMWQILKSLCLRCSLTSRSISSSWPLKTWLVPTPSFLPDLAPCEALIFMKSPKFRSSHWLSYMCFQKVFPAVAESLTHQINLEGDYFSGVAITSNNGEHIFCYWISPGTLGYTLINEKSWVCGPDDKSLIPGRSRDLISLPLCPDQVWVPTEPSVYLGTGGYFCRGKWLTWFWLPISS